jgi:putative chitinase
MNNYDAVTWSTVFKAMGVHQPEIDVWATITSHVIHKDTFDGGDEELAQFLGQCVHESDFFTSMEENFNYSPEGLIATFGSQRVSQAQAQALGRVQGQHAANRQGIANLVYGGEWGRTHLGNTQPNDGWDFRGSGWIQTTGRDNFARAEKDTGFPFTSNPDLMRQPGVQALQAQISWWKRNITMEMLTDDVALRKKVNTKGLGLDHTRSLTTAARTVISTLQG